jgi:hypothetical protein
MCVCVCVCVCACVCVGLPLRTCALTGRRCCTWILWRPRTSPRTACGHVRDPPLSHASPVYEAQGLHGHGVALHGPASGQHVACAPRTLLPLWTTVAPRRGCGVGVSGTGGRDGGGRGAARPRFVVVTSQVRLCPCLQGRTCGRATFSLTLLGPLWPSQTRRLPSCPSSTVVGVWGAGCGDFLIDG